MLEKSTRITINVLKFGSCKTCKLKRHCMKHRKYKMQGCDLYREKRLTCDKCGEFIPPPGTGALMGGDGKFYCAKCRKGS